MSKRLLIFGTIITILGLSIGLFIYVNEKLKDRKERQEAYKKAQEIKAEEIKVTILEGWTNKQIAEYLQAQNIIKAEEFLETVKNYNTIEYEEFLPKNSSPETRLQGFLYPDTYRFFKTIEDRSKVSTKEAGETIINKLLDNFKKKLPQNYENLAQKQGLSLYEAIILASIVEKEANNFPNEKATIAGIFLNRLNIDMPLQSDATVNYATGKNEASPSLVDLEVNSAYNTYINKGLPPAPISNPSFNSINAVLNPISSEYIYYLHDQKTGQPYYAKTYEEHITNKQKYLK